jgi:hypothetical protein
MWLQFLKLGRKAILNRLALVSGELLIFLWRIF